MGGCIALTSTNYAGKLELIYLQNVIQYLNQKRSNFKEKDVLEAQKDLFNFMQVSKKSYNLTYNPSALATRSDYFDSYSGEAHLDENLDFIIKTPSVEGVLQGDIGVTKYYGTKFRNAKIKDSKDVEYNCGDVFLAVRKCKLCINSKYFKRFDAIALTSSTVYARLSEDIPTEHASSLGFITQGK